MDESKIQVMELFGPTIQGEGIMSGTITHFLRTGGCGLRCSWCDSLFAVLPEEIKKHRKLMTTGEILGALDALPWAPYVTFTGGDPCIQERLGDLIMHMNNMDTQVAVETQGQFFPDWLGNADVITFSPKGPSSGNIVDPEDLIKFCIDLGPRRPQRICIKIVVFDQKDFEYAMSVYNVIPSRYYDAFYFTAGTPQGLPDPKDRVFEILAIQSALAGNILQESRVTNFNNKVHIGCQQHVLLWPKEEKGV